MAWPVSASGRPEAKPSRPAACSRGSVAHQGVARSRTRPNRTCRYVDAACEPAREVLFLRLDLDRVARFGHVDAVGQRGALHPATVPCRPPGAPAAAPSAFAAIATRCQPPRRCRPPSSKPAADGCRHAPSAGAQPTCCQHQLARRRAGTGSSKHVAQSAHAQGVAASAAHWRARWPRPPGVTRQPGLALRRSASCSPSSWPSSQALSLCVGDVGFRHGQTTRPEAHGEAGAAGRPCPSEQLAQGTARARHTRDITVPMGMCMTAATSA
jgi:hypothetical protein